MIAFTFVVALVKLVLCHCVDTWWVTQPVVPRSPRLRAHGPAVSAANVATDASDRLIERLSPLSKVIVGGTRTQNMTLR